MNNRKSDERQIALYIRVSTQRQANEGESLEEQEASLRAYCTYKGWGELLVYRDEGRSAKDIAGRPALQRLMEDVRAGKVGTIIIKKLDRFSRSILDFEHMYRELESYTRCSSFG